MKALGLYPGNPVDLCWLGDDFAGVVKRVGAGVTAFAPGDEVAGMGSNAFRSYLTLDHRALFRKPACMSFEEAAAIPTVFLTAYYALVNLARMQPGEKVLIHAATGGVGQAAIQVAHDIGRRSTQRQALENGRSCRAGETHLRFALSVLPIGEGHGRHGVDVRC
jgi:polyketide synthase 12